VVVTGHNGYLGSAVVPALIEAGYDVTGVDTYLFAHCSFGPDVDDVPAARVDVRNVGAEHFAGADAVVHLAGVPDHSLADSHPDLVHYINHRGAVNAARAAKAAGADRFVLLSSCRLYGAHGDDLVDEDSGPHPVPVYARAQALAERDIVGLADDGFSPTVLHVDSAFGMSPRLRADLVVNRLTGFAFATGEVPLESDGSPWRSLVHVQDVAAAARAVIGAPRGVVHAETFNVGLTEENYRIREVAAMVCDVVPGCNIVMAKDAGPDARSYRVSCEKIAAALPTFRPAWSLRRGVEELYQAYLAHGLSASDLVGRLHRSHHVQELADRDLLAATLRTRPGPSTADFGVTPPRSLLPPPRLRGGTILA
jgi:nucleoside-diphosphate-sugar epimerase